MSADQLVFGPVVLPLLGAALIFIAKAFLPGRSGNVLTGIGLVSGLVLPWVTLAVLFPGIATGGVYSGVVGGWFEGVGILYSFDGLAWLVNVLGYSVAGAAALYAFGAGPRDKTFFMIFLIQTAALAATVMTADLFNLFVCLEVLGIASYVLVAASDKPGAMLASFSYLMVSAAAMVFFLLGVFGFYRLTGSLSYAAIAEGLAALPDGGGTPAMISLALITAAVAMRVAVMPLYGWLPDAHALAPHAVSAVLSGVLIKTPLFALSRVLLIMPSGASAGELMGFAGAVTALLGVVLALAQKDAKRLLAYHSISQIGYVVCAWGVSLSLGPGRGPGLVLMAAAFLHALFHALFKGLLFLTVGTVCDCAGERNVYRLRGAGQRLREAGERVPVTAVGFFVGALAISAVPPLNGFASKSALGSTLNYFASELSGGIRVSSMLYWILFAAGIGTVASFIKLSRIFVPSPANSAAPTREPAGIAVRFLPALQLAEAFLAILCIAGGVAAPLIFRWVMQLLAVPGTEPLPYTLQLYSGSSMLKTVITLLSGTVLFLLATSRKGGDLLSYIRSRPRSFQGLFVAFALGTALLVVYLIYSSNPGGIL